MTVDKIKHACHHILQQPCRIARPFIVTDMPAVMKCPLRLIPAEEYEIDRLVPLF